MRYFAVIIPFIALMQLKAQTTEEILSYGVILDPVNPNTVCVQAYYDSDVADPDAQHLNSTVNLLIPNGIEVLSVSNKCGAWSLGNVTSTEAMQTVCGGGPYLSYQQQIVQDGPCTPGGTTIGVPEPLFTVTLSGVCDPSTLIRLLQGSETTFPEDECLNGIQALNGNTGTFDNDGNGPNQSNGGQSFIPPQPGETEVPCDIVLPLELLSFNVYKQGRSARLVWQTTNEVNHSHFEIQRKGEGGDFNNIGTIKSSLHVSHQTYQFEDASPLPGINYYRLLQVDTDGSSSYSPIRSLQFDDVTTGVRLYPNPTRGTLLIDIPVNGEKYNGTTLEVYSTEGRYMILNNTRDVQAGTTHLDVFQLSPGVYLARLVNPTTGETVFSGYFVKQ